MHLDAMTVSSSALDMSASTRTYPLTLTILTRASNTAEVAVADTNWSENVGQSPCLERRTHWLVDSSRTAVIGVEGLLGSHCGSRQSELCSCCRPHPLFLGRQWP